MCKKSEQYVQKKIDFIYLIRDYHSFMSRHFVTTTVSRAPHNPCAKVALAFGKQIAMNGAELHWATAASDLFSRSLESLHRSYGWRSLSNVRGHSSPSKITNFRGPEDSSTLAQR